MVQLNFKSELWMKSGCLLVDFSQLSRWMLTHDPLRHRHSDHYATSDKSPIVQEHHHHELHHDIWKICGNTFWGALGSAQLLGTSSLKVTPLFKNTIMSRSTINTPWCFDLILKWQKVHKLQKTRKGRAGTVNYDNMWHSNHLTAFKTQTVTKIAKREQYTNTKPNRECIYPVLLGEQWGGDCP